ncbi:MAG: hypothetical protein HQL56_03500 [Magnetococcales bacterium]|nr:hypothetical protein [Magnetococcales bacterium]
MADSAHGLSLDLIDYVGLSFDRIKAMAERIAVFGRHPNPVRMAGTLLQAMLGGKISWKELG